MDYRAEFTITLPENLLEALGIDEDTLFEAYFDDGKIKVRVLDEDDLDDEFEDDEDFDDEEVPEECAECPHFCWHCGACMLDE